MSDPMTSHEIEDVLSSIRRLVSEDLRPAARQAAAAAPTRQDPEAGKLMLTPALRIVPEYEPQAAPATDVAAETSLEGEVSAQEALETILEDGLAPEVSSAGTMSGFAPVDEVYDDIGLDEGDSGLKALLDTSTAEAPAMVYHADPAADELIWSAPGEPETPQETDLVLPVSEDVLESVPPAPDAHSHWTTQDMPDVDWADAETDWAEAEPEVVPFVAHPRNPDTGQDPLARAWADRAEAEVRAELEAKIAAARAHIMEPERKADADATMRAEVFEGDESEMDEESLREIVRDIIREELAGALGERITRNVRKLVRVEINRALTAREFE